MSNILYAAKANSSVSELMNVLMVGMLRWFVSADDVQQALAGNLIPKDRVETRPREIPDSVMDESIGEGVHSIQKHFEPEAWKAVERVVAAKRRRLLFHCGACANVLKDRAVFCDACMRWWDYVCVGLRQTPKAEHWFCHDCIMR